MSAEQPTAAAPLDRAQLVEMNEALMLGSLRQHERTETAEGLNAQLRIEIAARTCLAAELAEKARLLDLTHDAVIVRDMEGRIRYWNQGAEELYGWSRAEALGEVSHLLLQTEFPTPLEQMTEELHRTDRWIGELIHTTRDGRRVTVLVRKTLDRDSTGQPVAVLENLTNITHRKQAEETLRESEAFNRSIIESSPDCIKVLDLEGNLLSVESGQALLGIDDITPFLHESWIDLWDDEHRLAARAAVAAAATSGEGKFVGLFRTLRGEPKWWDVAISPILNAEGRAARLLAVSRDVTERRTLEESLVARAGELARADRSKDEFLAMLAHELRNPLAPLRNATEILHAPGVDAEAREMAVGILTRQIENMSQMIDDLLDVSRITEGKIELRLQVVALADVLHGAASLARPGIEARGQELLLALPAEPVFLHGDATRLEQGFGNLLTNASKYSGSGCHIALTAEVAAHHPHPEEMGARGEMGAAQPPEVIVRVRDDGLGIAPDFLPRIFELFVQATRSLDRAHGGLGIGLTLVQRLVKLHGGSIEARSAGLGHGSEFIVRLPILPAAAALAPPPATPGRDTPRRMLIVDDNADSARSMATLQSLRGHTTRTVFTGPEAVAAAADFAPEVVLLDIGLPGMDGYEVARQLRAMPALDGAFLVAMSGYGSDEDRARARLAGFDEYLVKPADHDLLRTWLRGRG